MFKFALLDSRQLTFLATILPTKALKSNLLVCIVLVLIVVKKSLAKNVYILTIQRKAVLQNINGKKVFFGGHLGFRWLSWNNLSIFFNT